jgi:hypothetical protein
MSWEKERVRAMWLRMFVCPLCSEGGHLPFLDQGEGDLQACHTV